MLYTVEIISILLVALAMAPAPIYYPGFTIAGGIGAVGGILSVLAILLLTPQATPAFRLRLIALVTMFGVQLVSWTFSQPVNKFWLQSTNLGSFSNA